MTDPRTFLQQLKNLRGSLVLFKNAAQAQTGAAAKVFEENRRQEERRKVHTDEKGKTSRFSSKKVRFSSAQRNDGDARGYGGGSSNRAVGARFSKASRGNNKGRGGGGRQNFGSNNRGRGGGGRGRRTSSSYDEYRAMGGKKKQKRARLVQQAGGNVRYDVSRVFHNQRIDDGQQGFMSGWTRNQSTQAIAYIASRAAMVNNPKLQVQDPHSTMMVRNHFTKLAAQRVPAGERMRLADGKLNHTEGWYDFPTGGRRIESLGMVNGPTTFTATGIAINPGVQQTFGWNSNAAQLFEFYETIQMVLLFKSLTGPGIVQSGVGVLAADYDVKDEAPSNLIEVENMDGAVRFEICDDAQLVVDNKRTRSLIPMNKRLVRSSTVTQGDAFLYDLATVYFCTQGQASTGVIGELFLLYKFRYSKPTTTVVEESQTELVCHFTTTQTAGNWWGTVANTTFHNIGLASGPNGGIVAGAPINNQIGLASNYFALGPNLVNDNYYLAVVCGTQNSSVVPTYMAVGTNTVGVNLLPNATTPDAITLIAQTQASAAFGGVFAFKAVTTGQVAYVTMGTPGAASGMNDVWVFQIPSNTTLDGIKKRVGPLCEMFQQGKHYMPLQHRIAHISVDGDWRDEVGAETLHQRDCPTIEEEDDDVDDDYDNDSKMSRSLVRQQENRQFAAEFEKNEMMSEIKKMIAEMLAGNTKQVGGSPVLVAPLKVNEPDSPLAAAATSVPIETCETCNAKVCLNKHLCAKGKTVASKVAKFSGLNF